MVLILCFLFFVVQATEVCPLLDSNVVEKYFDTEGGQLLIHDHFIKITVPKGAVAKGNEVQIQAAASLIGPYIIPEGFHPVSAFVWIGANYTFEKEVQVQIEHHAVLSHPEDLLQMKMLTACYEDKIARNDAQYKYKMHVATYKPQCTLKEFVCVYSTDHFCSNCVAASDKLPDRIVAYHMLPKSYESASVFSSEICFCYNLEACRKVMLFHYVSFIHVLFLYL